MIADSLREAYRLSSLLVAAGRAREAAAAWLPRRGIHLSALDDFALRTLVAKLSTAVDLE